MTSHLTDLRANLNSSVLAAPHRTHDEDIQILVG